MVNRWLIAFACAWINLFIFAAFRSSGVLFLSIIDTFHCTYQQAAWSLSITGSVASITGLLAGSLTHYFEIRFLVIIGVFCCGLSLIATYFSTSIQFVTLTVGLFQGWFYVLHLVFLYWPAFLFILFLSLFLLLHHLGIGIGLVVILLPAILNAHFVEKKAIALGISYAGATFGAFIFPVVIQSLLTEYAFHNTMLLLGGIFFVKK